MWSAQAEAEELTLLVAENKAGYFGVYHQPGRPKPYLAQVWRGGKVVTLGCFATAEEAALCIARSPEGQKAAQRAAAAPPLTSEEARLQAQAERLTLLVADNKAGYFGVNHQPGRSKPYEARLWRGGKKVNLGYFATAEEAALRVARSAEGQAAVRRAAAPPLTREDALQQAREAIIGAVAVVRLAAVALPPRRSEEESQGNPPAMPPRAVHLKEEGTVPPMPPGAFVKEEIPSMPTGAFFKEEEVVVPPMLLDAVVKREHAFVADEGGRRKRQR